MQHTTVDDGSLYNYPIVCDSDGRMLHK